MYSVVVKLQNPVVHPQLHNQRKSLPRQIININCWKKYYMHVIWVHSLDNQLKCAYQAHCSRAEVICMEVWGYAPLKILGFNLVVNLTENINKSYIKIAITNQAAARIARQHS